MWYEYPISANFERQKQIIRQLKKWIQDLEKRELVKGFAFNHYFSKPSMPNQPDELRIRFDYQDEENRKTVRNELVNEVRQLVPEYVSQERPWTSDEEVLKAYEFGSRCAFLFWELIEKGRFSEDYVSNFLPFRPKSQVPLNFQQHFNHGIMNSLGIPKQPHEQIIHLILLMESTHSKNIQELCEQIKRNSLLSQLHVAIG